MTLQEINKVYDRIIGSLDSKELKNAFDSLQVLISGCHEYFFQDKLNELQDTYKYMLRYRIQGVKDPMQEQIYNNIQASSYELADSIKQKAVAIESPLSYYSRRRTQSTQPSLTYGQLHSRILTEQETGNRKGVDDTNVFLFNKVWVSSFLSIEEAEEIRSLFQDHTLPFTTGCQIVSALMLGMQEMFDKEKIFLLFDAAEHPSEEVKARAITSLLITLYTYRKRTGLYPQIADRLATLAETPGFTQTIRTIILRFILARETEKITRKLQDEIIPEMVKLSPKISSKINLKDITPDQLEEMNPEWENFLIESDLGKKVKEFGELQQEGADLMNSTFMHLKNYSFFHELSNWLLPFTIKHSSFNGLFTMDNEALLDSSTMTIYLCNSDKYSFYLSILGLPKKTRDMMMTQFDNQVLNTFPWHKKEPGNKELGTIIGHYIQDLYRFFKQQPNHLDFTDIFTMPLDFHNLDILRPYISDKDSLTTIAEYYLRKNYFNDALVILNQLAETDRESSILFQKIGYCKQMAGDLKGALDSYMHADLLKPESEWVLQRIAGCYRSLKQTEEALNYYRRCEALDPDNLSVQISIGHCHLELKDYNEALKCFFKVDYLESKSHKAWRPIAWCSFLIGKYDQARNYYKKILEHRPNAQDLMNAGHTEWALQNINEALTLYRQAVQKLNGNIFKFQEQFNQDVPDLLIAGIEESEVPLMLEQLRYRIEGEI